MVNNIHIGCSVLIQRNHELLLGIRNKEFKKGKMILPGGGV